VSLVEIKVQVREDKLIAHSVEEPMKTKVCKIQLISN